MKSRLHLFWSICPDKTIVVKLVAIMQRKCHQLPNPALDDCFYGAGQTPIAPKEKQQNTLF